MEFSLGESLSFSCDVVDPSIIAIKNSASDVYSYIVASGTETKDASISHWTVSYSSLTLSVTISSIISSDFESYFCFNRNNKGDTYSTSKLIISLSKLKAFIGFFEN